VSVRIDHVETSGTFSLDGGTWDVDNNVWVFGDDDEVVIIDAAHDVDAIVQAVNGRRVKAIIATHAHDDHINVAPALSDATGGPILLHPGDHDLWKMTHPDRDPDGELSDTQLIEVAGVPLQMIHTPGHAPGSICIYAPDLSTVFSGDTLFAGGPGATGRSFSDFPTIIDSIRDRLLVLPPATVVRTGHGPTTTIGDEAPDLPAWIERGH
jgi:glyoxylase-like metal-dependent hydrolase (beta-lactamase superfamily II)